MKVVKVIRLDDWLDVVHEDCIYLQFSIGHSIDEAHDLYKKFLSQPERLNPEGATNSASDSLNS